MRIYCSTSDRYPLRYVDVVELFLGEMKSRGLEQTWYTQATGAAGRLRVEVVKGTRVIVPPVIARWGLLGKLITKGLYWTIELGLMLQQLWKPADMIIVRDKYWGALLGLLIGRIRGIPFAIWMSYPFPEDDRERAASVPQPMRTLLRISGLLGTFVYYGIAARFADHCFVQSEQMKREMHARGVRNERMTAVPMGVTREFLAQDVGTRPPRKDPPVVLYLGTLHVLRRLEFLIDVFAEVLARRPDTRFEIVGSGPDPEDQLRLERLAESRGIRAQILFTGQLPMMQARQHVLQASVCVSPFVNSPTQRVASPTKLVEYLSLGKATVCNLHPEQSLITEASQGALCVPWSSTAFADAIVWCLNHPQQADEMAERGRRWVLANRTYDQLGDLVHGKLMALMSRNA